MPQGLVVVWTDELRMLLPLRGRLVEWHLRLDGAIQTSDPHPHTRGRASLALDERVVPDIQSGRGLVSRPTSVDRMPILPHRLSAFARQHRAAAWCRQPARVVCRLVSAPVPAQGEGSSATASHHDRRLTRRACRPLPWPRQSALLGCPVRRCDGFGGRL